MLPRHGSLWASGAAVCGRWRCSMRRRYHGLGDRVGSGQCVLVWRGCVRRKLDGGAWCGCPGRCCCCTAHTHRVLGAQPHTHARQHTRPHMCRWHEHRAQPHPPSVTSNTRHQATFLHGQAHQSCHMGITLSNHIVLHSNDTALSQHCNFMHLELLASCLGRHILGH